MFIWVFFCFVFSYSLFLFVTEHNKCLCLLAKTIGFSENVLDNYLSLTEMQNYDFQVRHEEYTFLFDFFQWSECNFVFVDRKISQ
jgi:hypothetical protein